MLIQGHCDEHRMRRHKKDDMRIVLGQRRKTISEDLDEMNQVFENMRRHIEQHHEMMAQEGRRKII